MECPLCQSPLAEGATVCGACGAEVLAEVPEISTLAGGRGPDTTGGPPRGEVLAERWEIEERVGADVLMSRYRAHDQETEARVVLTLIAPDLLPSARERDAVRDRLASAVGVGNKYLPGLLDVDREAQFVFAVEPLVVGASLRSVLDARRARNETMHVSEVLPVVAQLAAALAGIAPPHHHGDVRAERVLIGKEGLRLVGAFIVPALPSATVARALGGDDGWRRVLAPEALRGAAGDAADRFGVAAIAFEALTGRLPGITGPLLVRELEPVEEALRALLAPDPATRSRTLEALIEALAECAHLPIPDLDPAAFRRVRRAGSSRPVSQRPTSSGAASLGAAFGTASIGTASIGTASIGTASIGASSAASGVVEPALLAPAAASLDTAPESRVDADATSRMQALNEDGELDTVPLAPSSSYPDIPDLATDPSAPMPTADGPARAAQILMPDALPPTYRLDEGPTLAENSLRTRRVVAHSEPPAVLIPAPANATAAPVTAKLVGAPATAKPTAAPVTAKLVGAPATAKPTAAPATAKPTVAAAQHTRPRSEPPSPLARSAEPRPRAIAGASAGGTQEISMDEVFEAAPAKKKRADDSLDPRLVRAALGVSLDDLEDAELDDADLETDAEPSKPAAGNGNGTKKRADDSLDPRLVRAALGVALEAVDDDEEPPTTMRAAASRPKKSSADTQQLTSDDLAEMSAAASRRAARVTSDTGTPSARRKRDAEPARVVKIPRYEVAKSPGAAAARAVPRPAADGAAKPHATSRTLPEPPRVAAKPAAAQPLEEPPPPLEAQRTETATRALPQRAAVMHADDLATPPPRPSNGRAVIWISLGLAIAIICAGAAVAWWRHSSAVRERERVRQERFELLRRHQP